MSTFASFRLQPCRGLDKDAASRHLVTPKQRMKMFSVSRSNPLSVKVTPRIASVDSAAWDACAIGDLAGQPNPFISHAFLFALEASGCVGGRTGWTPSHVLVTNQAEELLAAAPCYLKMHSQGEYVFDHAFADAFERVGGQYYPKLQVASPFSPVPGPRLLVRAGPDAEDARRTLIDGLLGLRRQCQASSVHVTFATEADARSLAAASFLERHDQQFHWRNEGYADFEAFLASLASRKRKAIRRERRDALANGITIHWLTGADLVEEHWDAFFSFYMDTGSRKWGRPYLNRAFFSKIGRTMADRILLIMARRDDRWIAGAINFIGDDALYGRNWGCIEEHPFLHFEVCYYQAIEFAIRNRLTSVEAGAQGEHKLARGYLPRTTYSAHVFGDARLQSAVDDYLRRERAHVAAYKDALTAEGPFRKSAEIDA
jgi:hypothetical protein